jgi:DNA polymerase-3 subunit epsilon
MDFVAIDVETANADMASICQIGIASYKQGVLAEEWKSYINPEDYFDGFNIAIHGITEAMVSTAPKLPNVKEILHEYMDNRVCVCHTHFDRVAIKQAFCKYDMTVPNCTWLDSAQVARRTWKEFSHRGYSLNNICTCLSYEFKHHDALEDAKAAAHILNSAIQQSGIDLESWLIRAKQPSNSSPSNLSEKREGNTEGALYGEVLVFTGALSMHRHEAADMAAHMGCTVGSGVNSRTTLLVVGDQDIQLLAGHEKSIKHRKAEKLISEGQSIRILRETDFKELVNSVGGEHYELSSKIESSPSNVRSRESMQFVIGPNSISESNSTAANELEGRVSIDELKVKMIKCLNRDSKREYLELCRQHYSQAVSIHQELFPEFYKEYDLTDPFDGQYAVVIKAEKEGNVDEAIRILETAITNRSTIPGCYQRLAVLYSKMKNHREAYEACKRWFDYGFWTSPQASTTSLNLLDRLEKLKDKI